MLFAFQAFGIVCMKIISMLRAERGYLNDGQALGLPKEISATRLFYIISFSPSNAFVQYKV